MEPKQKQHPVVDEASDRSKIRCCKEQYYIGTWNVWSMNQGKLEVVKQETARVNINILGISKLRWTGMGEFNSDNHYIYYCGQGFPRRNGVAIIVNKRVWNATLGYLEAISKMKEWSLFISISILFIALKSKPFNSTIIQVYAPTSNTEEAEVERFYEDLQDLLELSLQKDVLFIIRGWNTKVGSQETPGETGKFGLGVQNEAGQRLTEFCQEKALGIANTLFQQHKWRLHMDITRWSTLKSDWLYPLQLKMEKLYIVSKKRPGVDCGSSHESLIAKFRLQLKKVG